MPGRSRLAQRFTAALGMAAMSSLCAAPLPASVDTAPMAMTGIGDTVAPAGAMRKALPSVVPTDAMTMTGTGS